MSLCVLRDGLVKQKKTKKKNQLILGAHRAADVRALQYGLNKEAILYQQHTISAHIKFE